MTFEQWTGLLTTLGILATFGLSLYIWLCHTRPSRKVKVDFVDHPQREEGEVIGIIFINERGPEVTIEEAGFKDADGKTIVRPQLFGSISTSAVVLPGHRHIYYYGRWEWRKAIREGEPVPDKAYCRYETGRYDEVSLSQEIKSALLE